MLWGLPFFRDLVPDHIYSRLKDVAVNPEAEEAGEAEDLTYFDMQSGKSLYACPDSANRIRVKRHGLREALLDGIDVQVSSVRLLVHLFTPNVPSYRIRAITQAGVNMLGH